MPAPHPRITHDRRVLLMAFAGWLPAAITALAFLWFGEYTAKVQWTLTVVIVGFGLGFVFALRERVVLPLQTLSNLLAALGEGDFSIRARGARQGDPLGEVMVEVNALVDTLRDQRMGALEATMLLRKVMAEIDVAVFTFDGEGVLKFINRAGARLLGQPAERLLGRHSSELGLADSLEGEAPRVLNATFPAGPGRWEIRRSSFRQGGRPHEMLVLSDLSQALREEERLAWQRLIRVIGHEMNNSLAPIKSIAGSLATLLERDPPSDDWQEDALRGLAVIAARSESLSRFMTAYARLARLPPPKFAALDVSTFVQRVVGLERHEGVTIQPGPVLTVHADGDQLEQLLINLVRNAVDASRETGGGVRLGWTRLGGSPDALELCVEDDGPGLPNTANLFVPFFTTKPGGSGIGLVLCRQIAEAHGGSLTLENRPAGRGCRAALRLPLVLRMPSPDGRVQRASSAGAAATS
ncbi:MAG TPA: ATP-binding protein [Vicinamibacterales bacterium]|nr:ATP-binding protein [Vicinamibacterales bacterium]